MNIRNFCIIAHIDHGKSTLSDRLLEVTGTISKREMKEQLLDQMELERERGITIKLQPVRMEYTLEKTHYSLNLIDTPGHVDFGYEVSRSLAAVEGAILLVDATQGIQAQTLANLYLALEQNLTILPVLNKIDLPGARVEEITEEVVNLLGCDPEEILCVSAKTGEGVDKLLEEITKRIPPPQHAENETPQALIFDSAYDEYRGVVAYIRMFQGTLKKGDLIHLKATKTETEVLDIGVFKPTYTSTGKLEEGEIGYLITGLKEVRECGVGDTIVAKKDTTTPSLAGYKAVSPMVYAGFFCKEGSDFQYLREAVEKLKVNDASFTFEPEHSPALGHGFRCGFLGLLHLEIIQERLKREFNLDLVVTVPSVAYNVHMATGTEKVVHSPLELPDMGQIDFIEEPWTKADIITPDSHIGAIMSLIADKKGIYKNTEYISSEKTTGEKRAIIHFELPLSSILVDFYDTLKSVTSGYASLNYELIDYRRADVVRLDILVAEQPVEALASITYRDQAHHVGKKIVTALKESLPRQMFEIKLQAAIGSKVVAAERLSAMRKDVTAKLYGGDVSRKQKLLKKQKKGKKRMQSHGKVDIPTDTYLKILKR